MDYCLIISQHKLFHYNSKITFHHPKDLGVPQGKEEGLLEVEPYVRNKVRNNSSNSSSLVVHIS